MPYILDPLYIPEPGGGIISSDVPWSRYLNPAANGKWVGHADLVQCLDQAITLDITAPVGTWQKLYYPLVAQLGNWEFNVRKVDEWIEISPTHKGYYDLVMGEKEKLEVKIKTVIDDIIKHVSDLELLEHDFRRYKEFNDYFKTNDEHSIKAVFVDLVDFHSGESAGGGAGRLSMSFMQQNNIFPTIIQDFYEMTSEEDLEKKDRLKNLPRVEKDMLKTKWRAYQEWKKLFGAEVEKRFKNLGELIESKKKMIEQSRNWIKPYIARHKMLKEGMEEKKERETRPFKYWYPSTEATGETVITLWAWKEFEPPEFYKVPGELMALKPGFKLYDEKTKKMCDRWTMEHLIMDDRVGLKEKYPWITEEWVHEKTEEIMEKDDLFRARKRVKRPYLYYSFMEIIFDKWLSRSPTGSEKEDTMITVRSYWMSQNVLLVKLLELKAREEEFEDYVNSLLGIKKEIAKEGFIGKKEMEIEILKKEKDIKRMELDFQEKKKKLKEIKDPIEKKKAEIDLKEREIALKKSKKELENLKKRVASMRVEEAGTVRNIANTIGSVWEKFNDFFGFRFKIFKAGPYETDFSYRITKFHLKNIGKFYYGPVVNFLRKKIMV